MGEKKERSTKADCKKSSQVTTNDIKTMHIKINFKPQILYSRGKTLADARD